MPPPNIYESIWDTLTLTCTSQFIFLLATLTCHHPFFLPLNAHVKDIRTTSIWHLQENATFLFVHCNQRRRRKVLVKDVEKRWRPKISLWSKHVLLSEMYVTVTEEMRIDEQFQRPWKWWLLKETWLLLLT